MLKEQYLGDAGSLASGRALSQYSATLLGTEAASNNSTILDVN
jgi:hypothetical protein